jgi:hypothetical protein
LGKAGLQAFAICLETTQRGQPFLTGRAALAVEVALEGRWAGLAAYSQVCVVG